MTDLNTKTNAELVAIHNDLNPMAPLKSWKQKKETLIERIQKLEAAGPDTVEEVVEAPVAEVVTAEKVKNPNRGKIKQMTFELLREVVSKDENGRNVGHSYQDIMDMILTAVPTAKPSIKSLQWYASKMNQDEALPLRPRKKKGE